MTVFAPGGEGDCNTWLVSVPCRQTAGPLAMLLYAQDAVTASTVQQTGRASALRLYSSQETAHTLFLPPTMSVTASVALMSYFFVYKMDSRNTSKSISHTIDISHIRYASPLL